MLKHLKPLAIQLGVYRPMRFIHDQLFARWRLRELDKNVAFYAPFIQRGELCFDLGANIGDKMAAMVALGARVVAVEPQRECIDELTARYCGNDGVHIVAKVVGSEPGAGKLRLSAKSTQFASMMKGWHDTGDTYADVIITTFDELVREYGHPVFCKIDVEGFELEVFRGMTSPPRRLCFEYHLTDELWSGTLACLNYLEEKWHPRFNFSPIEQMAFELPTWCDHGAFVKELDVRRGDVRFFYGDVYVDFGASS